MLKLIQLTRHHQPLFFGQSFQTTIITHRLNIFQTTNRLLNSLEICKHSTKPAVVNVWHTRTLCLFAHSLLSSTLGSNKQDLAILGCNTTNEVHCILKHWQCLLKVDDMDFVTIPKNIWGHLWIPKTGLVAKMDTGFKHLSHRNGHIFSLSIFSQLFDLIVK